MRQTSENASGDQSACQTVASKFANEKKDLILAIATPAAQAVAGSVSDAPVLVTCVTDPAESGLVESNDKPGANVTGTSDLTPVKEQIDLLKQLVPDAKTVGVLYCSAESNSKIQADMAKEALAAVGMEGKDYTVSSSNEIQTVVQSMAGSVECDLCAYRQCDCSRYGHCRNGGSRQQDPCDLRGSRHGKSGRPCNLWN